MLKRDFTYTNFDGSNVTETCYFALNKSEIIDMQVRGNGTFIDNLKDLLAKRDIERLYGFFKELVLDSYGVRREGLNGVARFVKSPEIREDFRWSIPYSEMLTEMMTSEDSIQAFVRGIMPFDVTTEMLEEAKEKAAAYAQADSTGA